MTDLPSLFDPDLILDEIDRMPWPEDGATSVSGACSAPTMIRAADW